jgi:glycosyltransferase involved in cell wall biosynthesis
MIALCMISEGDHPNLKRAVASVYKYVDHIFITTTKVNKPQWEDKKISWSYFEWNDNFAAARNFNLKQVPVDFRYIMWLDSDDVVKDAVTIPEVVQSMEDSSLDAVFVDYNYDIDKNGNVLIVHPRERIVRRGIYTWKSALHETLIPNRRVRNVFIKDFAVNHYPTKENKTDGLVRNLRILQADYEIQRKAVIERLRSEIDPRTEYYLARCLFDTHTEIGYKKAFNLFQDYLQHSGWDEERAFAWNYLGNIFYQQQQYKDSLDAYLGAIKERPEFPTWHINLARSYAALKDFEKAEHHITVAVNMEQPKTSMILTPTEDRINSLIVMFYVFFNKKDFKQAIKSARMLYDLQPTKENFNRIQSVEKLMKWTDWMKSVTGMVQELNDKGEMDKIDQMLESLPDDVKDTAYVDTLRSNFAKPKVWGKNSICYYAAIDLHEWSPLSLQSGLGGSEESIVYLSKLWAASGYDVTVYTNVGANEGTYEGVKYLNYQRFNPKDKFDIVIGWRNPHFIHKNLLDARLVLLDLHDIPEVGEYDEELLNRVDYIMVKSDYHRSLLPEVPDNKFVIINNGIDWQFLQEIKAKKNVKHIFYGSSPDRGLQGLLEIWPQVKQAVPEAELHVCYGFDLYDKVHAHIPHKMKWRNMMMTLLKQDGIVYHGKVGKKALYEIAKGCGVWAYPTTFEEIDCITARYCQALGTVPLVYNYAALVTTVQRGVRLPVDPFDKQSIKIYQAELISMLQNPIPYPDMVKNSERFSWESVADRWLDVFEADDKPDIKLTVFTPTIRSGFWNLMADNLSRQTHKNFEWLIVDDYPEDRRKLAEKYAKKYNLDIRYMRGKKKFSKYNYALIQADNMAIWASKGELIVWLQDFILLPDYALDRMARLYKRYPKAIQAPVDEYRRMSVKPNLDNKEDWFDGKLDIVGEFIRKNIRIKREELRLTNNPYDFEMNVGAIPTHIARLLNGLWEFQDDGLGYNNTEIAFRALKIGCPIFVDERIRAVCLDLWEHIAGTDENAKDREWNLNDPRFEFIYSLTNKGKLPIIRDPNIDRKIKLTYKMPKGLDQDGATKWIQKNVLKVAKQWEEEFTK